MVVPMELVAIVIRRHLIEITSIPHFNWLMSGSTCHLKVANAAMNSDSVHTAVSIFTRLVFLKKGWGRCFRRRHLRRGSSGGAVITDNICHFKSHRKIPSTIRSSTHLSNHIYYIVKIRSSFFINWVNDSPQYLTSMSSRSSFSKKPSCSAHDLQAEICTPSNFASSISSCIFVFSATNFAVAPQIMIVISFHHSFRFELIPYINTINSAVIKLSFVQRMYSLFFFHGVN